MTPIRYQILLFLGRLFRHDIKITRAPRFMIDESDEPGDVTVIEIRKN